MASVAPGRWPPAPRRRPGTGRGTGRRAGVRRTSTLTGGLGPAVAVATVVAILGAACDGGDDDRGTSPAPTSTTAAPACAPGPSATASGAVDAPGVPFDTVEDRGVQVVGSAGDLTVTATERPLTIAVADGRGVLVQEAPGGGLFLVRGDERMPLREATEVDVGRCGIVLTAPLDDGTTATVTVRAHAGGLLSVELVPGGSGGVTAWGETLVSPPGERIYGLTERIVDDYGASELAPRAVGGLDRKGETVTMWVRPTISAYAPFHHSSVGYGLLVDGTMPGTYDLGATDPARVAFEFELDPGARAARYFVIPGRGHDRILDGYTALVGRPVLPPESVFDHWLGHDELPPGEPVLVDGVPLNPAVADDLLGYERHGIPAGVYHFDRPWAVGSAGYGAFAFDPGRFPDPVGMLGLLRDRGWRSQVWISEWALDDRAAAAAAYGWLAPGSDRVIDLTHPDAAAWLEEDLVTFLEGPEGSLVDGFFLDRTDEVVPSEAGDVYHDGRNGRQVHNAYPVLAQEVVRAALDRARDSGGWLVARAAYTGSSGLTMTWGGDTHSREGVIVPEQPDVGPSTDLGLRSVLVSLQRAAFMGLVYWGSDIGGYNELADREVYARWIEVGALSPLMRFHGKGRMMPWNMPTEPTFDEEMLGIYRRYVVLHHALGDYLYGLAERAHETGAPIARPLVFDFPDDPRVGDLWDQWMLGPDLLVAPVWESGARRRPVYVPAGTWVDFWDRDRVVVGPADLDEPVPLDRVPLFVREGSPLLDLRPPP